MKMLHHPVKSDVEQALMRLVEQEGSIKADEAIRRLGLMRYSFDTPTARAAMWHLVWLEELRYTWDGFLTLRALEPRLGA